MGMTKKDFIAIADAIYISAGQRSTMMTKGQREMLDWLIIHISMALKAINPNFDRARFIEWANNGPPETKAMRRAKIAEAKRSHAKAPGSDDLCALLSPVPGEPIVEPAPTGRKQKAMPGGAGVDRPRRSIRSGKKTLAEVVFAEVLGGNPGTFEKVLEKSIGKALTQGGEDAKRLGTPKDGGSSKHKEE